MKLEGYFHDIPIYSHPDCPLGNLYLINNDKFEIDYPRRKDGKLDMRYKINRLRRAFGIE